MKIFIAAGETSLGPYTVEEIREAINDGSIQADGLGCIEGESAWHPISALLNPRPADPVPVAVSKPAQPRVAAQQANIAPQPRLATQKPNIAPPRMTAKPSTTENEHLAVIRKKTCYTVLRAVVNFVTIVSCCGWVILMISIAMGENPIRTTTNATPAAVRLMLMIIPVSGILLSIAAQQAALLLADIADTLIYDSNRKKRE